MPSLEAVKRNRRLRFQQRSVASDEYNGDVETWAEVFRAWASVSFGTAMERREAAQETASMTATFTILRSAQTQQISTTEHRFLFDGGIWDITSVVPSIRLNRGLDITGIRRSQ